MANLVRNTTIYALGDIIPRLFNFITFPVLTHYLTPAEYGIINYINTLNAFLLVFSVLSLNTYYLVFYYRQENKTEQRKLLGNLTIFIVGITAAISILAYFFGYYLTDVFQNEIKFFPYIALGIATNFFNVFSVLPLATYRVEENPLPVTIINVIKSVLVMLLTILLVVKFNYKALGVLWATLVVTAIFAIWFIAITIKKSIFCFNWKQIKSALAFSLPLVPGSIAYYLVSMSDRILIEKYVGLSELGIYGTASTLALLLNIISTGAYKAFEPYFFKIYGTENFIHQFKQVQNAFLLVLLIGASGLALFSKEALILMASESFLSAYLYVPPLLIGVLSSSICLLFGTVLTAQSKTKTNSMISILGGCASVIANVILLPHIGILGACLTSAIVFTGMLAATISFSKIKTLNLKVLSSIVFTFAMIVYPIYFLNIKSIVLSIGIKILILATISLVSAYLLNIKFKKSNGSLFNKLFA